MGRVKEMNEDEYDEFHEDHIKYLLKIEERKREMIIKQSVDEFLLEGGVDLGYDDLSLPRLKDMEAVLENKVTCWEYYGYRTEKEYYHRDCNHHLRESINE